MTGQTGSQGLGQLKSQTAVILIEFFTFFYRVFNSLFFYVFKFFLFIRIKMKKVPKVCAESKLAPVTCTIHISNYSAVNVYGNFNVITSAQSAVF